MQITIDVPTEGAAGCSLEEHLKLLDEAIQHLQLRKGYAPSALTNLRAAVKERVVPEPKWFGAIVRDALGYQWVRYTGAPSSVHTGYWVRRGSVATTRTWEQITKPVEVEYEGMPS